MEVVEATRAALGQILEESGHGDGLPEAGDHAQAFEIRLMGSLLSAFQDPDWYFCQFWARGVWLGSPDRKLPRTPAVFDRKVKWRFAEPGGDLHGEWRRNYPSLDQHAELVLKQFQAEAEEGLMVQTTVGEALKEYGPDR